MLRDCLASLLAVDGGSCEVTLVDNASGDGVLTRVKEEFPAVRIIQLEKNLGFAAAVNQGLAEAGEDFILLLNTDAVLAPGALKKMEAALEAAGDSCAGVAPKMMSSAHAGIIDAIGTVMPKNGAPFNRGIGQCDQGQYDSAEDVAGVCFGAALLRRELFDAGRVGPLYEGYFLYFEDSDWCMRASSQGYRFLTVPEAVVYHMHSGVIRNESLAFKYKLVELNTLKIVVRTFGSRRRAAVIVAARTSRLLARTFIRRRYIIANISTLASFMTSLPGLLGERWALKKMRVTGDAGIFKLAEGEDAFFDTVTYEPHRCLQSLIATYERLLAVRHDPEEGKLLAALYRLRQETAAGKTIPGEEYRAAFAGAAECVRDLMERALAEAAAA